MNRIFTKYGIAVLSVAALIAIILCVMTAFSSSSAVLPNVAGTIATPFRTIGTTIVNKVEEWTSYFTEYDALKAENEQLKRDLARLEADIRQAEYDREENKLLRDLLKLTEQRRDLSFESALIVERDGSNWARLLTVNKGTLSGITVGDCVIDQYGNMVGVISEAGLNWATVRTLLDSETGVGARVFRSGLNAVAQGDFALMNEDLLSLEYLSTGSDVMGGDLIVTSGLGDYLPSDIVIGYVEELRTSDDGLSRRAIIRPETEFDELTELFIITDFTIVN